MRVLHNGSRNPLGGLMQVLRAHLAAAHRGVLEPARARWDRALFTFSIDTEITTAVT